MVKYQKNSFIFYIILFGLLFIIYKYKYSNKEAFETYNLPRTIWIFWDQAELPNDINAIIKNNKKILSNFKFNVLNNQNLNTYLDTSRFPENYAALSVQAKSDFIRLNLLKKYGGVWMDAGIIINSSEEFERLFNECLNRQADLLAFTKTNNDDNSEYHPYIESWFLIAPQNSKLINLWLIEFEHAVNIGFDAYNKYIIDDLNVKICDGIKGFGTYLTMHMCLQTVLQKKLNGWKPILILESSEETMYKLHEYCRWNKECIVNKFENDIDDIKQIPYMKFNGDHRQYGIDFDKYFL